jgi:hypothetical protein
MKNLMTTLLIGGAYLCVAGNAMGIGHVIITSNEYNGHKVNFNIVEEVTTICKTNPNAPPIVGDPNDKVSCPGLLKIKQETELLIHVAIPRLTYCKVYFSYKPDRDIWVDIEDNNNCTVGFKK